MHPQERRSQDIILLQKITAQCNEPELEKYQMEQFRRMLGDLENRRQFSLTFRQRKWAEETWAGLKPIDTKTVPKGTYGSTPVPEVLQNPKEALKRKPPLPKRRGEK
jgi:hypothetical protein